MGSSALGADLSAGEVIWLEKDAQGEAQPRVPSRYYPGEEAGVLFKLGGYAVNAKGMYQLRLHLTLSDPRGGVLFKTPGPLLQDKSETDRGAIHQTFFFNIPVYMPGGAFKLRLDVTDEVAKKKVAVSSDFSVQREKPLVAAHSLTARELSFSKTADGPPLTPASYEAGETLRYRFEIAGIQFRGDKLDVGVGMKLVTAGGEVAFEDATMFDIRDSLEYHPNTLFLPIAGHVGLDDEFPPGDYRIEWTVTDRHAQKSVRLNGRFTVKSPQASGPRFQSCRLLEGKDGPVREATPYGIDDTIHLRCEIAGYAVDAQQQINAGVRLTATDPAGVALLKPYDIEFNQKLEGSSRPPLITSFSLPLPRYSPAGAYRLSVSVQDRHAGKSVSTTIPFELKRARPPPAASTLTLRSFAFASEEGGPARTPPRFKGGEALHLRFELAGFKFHGDQPDVHVALRLLGPDGAVLLDQTEFVSMKDSIAYRTSATYLPVTGQFAIPPETPAGAYMIDLAVTDRIARKTIYHKSSFQIDGTPGNATATSSAAAAEVGSSLLIAAQEGDIARVRALLARKADVNEVDDELRVTPLLLAAQNGHVAVVQALLAAGANVEAGTVQGATPLLLAAQKGHLQIVKELLAKKAKVNDRHGEQLFTVLILAASNGHTDVVKALLAAGADTRIKAANDVTALLVAAERGDLAMVQVLLAAKAEVNAVGGSNHTTPLIAAAWGGHQEVVKVLLAAGADSAMSKSGGWTALMLAAQEGHTQAVRALIAAGAKVNAQNPEGVTALLLASQNGHLDAVRALLEAHADPALKTSSGAMPLLLARHQKHAHIVALLERSGAR